MIDILLSTYNGSRFIEAFIQSLAQQTYQDFRIVWRDDMSSDNTAELLTNACQRNRIPLTIIESGKNLGVVRSFSTLLDHVQSDYACFADQDDIWLENKLERMLTVLQQLEGQRGKDTPLLLHSDLIVCDSALNVITPSLWNYQNISPERNGLRDLLVQNSVTGCATMFNRTMAEFSRDIPEQAICHDWFMALAASISDSVYFLPEPLIQYRQHGNNCIAAKKYGFRNWIHHLFSGRSALRKRIRATQLQAAAFAEKYQGILTEEQYALAKQWSTLPELPYAARLRFIHKNALRKNSFLRNLGFYWSV